MSDYIKREDAISALHGEAEIDGVKNAMAVQHLIGRFVYNIADIPSADVVERKSGEWIPVSERLPNESVKCLASLLYDGYLYTIIDTWDSEGREWINHYRGDGGDIIAWQPLPTPYVADRKE